MDEIFDNIYNGITVDNTLYGDLMIEIKSEIEWKKDITGLSLNIHI